MELAHLGEARAGSKCGRMDQCCALGASHVGAMFFDGDDVQIYEVRADLRGHSTISLQQKVHTESWMHFWLARGKRQMCTCTSIGRSLSC